MKPSSALRATSDFRIGRDEVEAVAAAAPQMRDDECCLPYVLKIEAVGLHTLEHAGTRQLEAVVSPHRADEHREVTRASRSRIIWSSASDAPSRSSHTAALRSTHRERGVSRATSSRICARLSEMPVQSGYAPTVYRSRR